MAIDEDKVQDSEGLLHDEKPCHCQGKFERPAHNPAQSVKCHIFTLYVINTCLFLALIVALRYQFIHDPTMDIFSPANHVVEYEDVVFYDGVRNQSPYQRLPPDDEVDTLWAQLYRNTMPVKIDRKSSTKLPNETVVAPGSPGEGLVHLELFHGLHCVNALRKSMWPERYPEYAAIFPNGTRNDFMTIHNNHCVDRIRQNIMCAGNIGTIYWTWRDGETPPRWKVNMETTHKCRNFDKILDWAIEHNYTGWDDQAPSVSTNEWHQ